MSDQSGLTITNPVIVLFYRCKAQSGQLRGHFSCILKYLDRGPGVEPFQFTGSCMVNFRRLKKKHIFIIDIIDDHYCVIKRNVFKSFKLFFAVYFIHEAKKIKDSRVSLMLRTSMNKTDADLAQDLLSPL